MKKALFIVAMLPMLAFAGKAEREFLKNDVAPAIKSAEEAVKTSCGCSLKVTVNEASFKNVDAMYQAKYIGQNISEKAAGYCTDAESKKAVCKMKTLEIKHTPGTDSKFEFSGSRGLASTNGNSYTDFDMMTKELDK